MDAVSELIGSTRPTAVNLMWAIDRMKRKFESLLPEGAEQVREGLIKEALDMQAEDIEINRRMGKNGAELVPDGARILTHCNAGALATAGYGTALGVVRAAVEAGKKVEVYADETRPFLQGARLTAWELAKDKIPVTVITDNMAGYMMAKGNIDVVIVGSDRIAANGDVANKIGTYSVAVLAHEHGIPFYAVAPTSTFDLTLSSGDQIPIEQRTPDEVTHVQGVRITPEGVPVANPAFDVTPNRYITAIVCENGVARAPYVESMRRLAEKGKAA
jgi:methylthioribose-1-phosphate isomerase